VTLTLHDEYADARIGSLCTGVGGLDLAVLDVFGGTVAWHCENDPAASKALKRHWPDVPNHGDLSTVDWTTVEPVDVLTAGFPCQDLSYAGRGAGIVEGSRSGLWYQVARAIGILRPGLVVLENVDAIVARRPGLDVVAASLAELGFDADWCVVPASAVGAPHRRLRWFCAAWPAADSERGGRDGRAPEPQPAGRAGRGTPATWWGAGPGDAADTDGAARGRILAGGIPPRPAEGTLRETRRGTGRDSGSRAPADAHGSRRQVDRTEPSRPELTDAVGGDGATAHADGGGCGRGEEPHSASRPPDPGLASGHNADGLGVAARGVDWGIYAPAVERWAAILGRPAPAPTEPGRAGQPRLSPAFVQWMQGLPAGWVTDPAIWEAHRETLGKRAARFTPATARNAQLKCLGNGCVPQQAAVALRMLLDGRTIRAGAA